MNLHTARRPEPQSADFASGVDLLLASGGDERIAPDPVTRRNRYGTMATPSPGEIFLSSSTASTITPRAYRAAESAWAALTAGSIGDRRGLEPWFDDIRARLAGLFGIAGCGVILTGSGTEAELTTLTLVKSVLHGPLTNIVVAPAETGSGVLSAANGAHFINSTAFGERCAAGVRLDGWTDSDIERTSVEIRDASGAPRSAADVDEEARTLANAALAAGRNVLLHCLESSKTGLAGLTPATAAQIQASSPRRVAVVVDCCQLRCSREHVRRMLRLGFMVVITGSKFFAGPPFSAALLAPAGLLRRVERWAPPAGLADYSSRLDWPGDLREELRMNWRNEANVGLGLRWVAALSEMERFFATPEPLRRAALACFERAVRERANRLAHVDEAIGGAALRPKGILSFFMTHPDGAPFSAAETVAVHGQLRRPLACGAARGAASRRIFHLGQPVAIGGRWALRVCASAPLISEVVERMAPDEGPAPAFEPWRRRIDALFEKWAALMDET